MAKKKEEAKKAEPKKKKKESEDVIEVLLSNMTEQTIALWDITNTLKEIRDAITVKDKRTVNIDSARMSDVCPDLGNHYDDGDDDYEDEEEDDDVDECRIFVDNEEDADKAIDELIVRLLAKGGRIKFVSGDKK